MSKTVGIVLFDGFEDLDAIGPREALSMMAMASGGRWEVVLVSEDGGQVRSSLGTRYLADHSFESCPPLDVVLVPGGDGTRREMKNPRHLEFVKRQGRQAQWVTSVCTGALVLHQAGFLEGKRATTYWGALNELQNLGGNTTVVSDERWVHDGNVITAAGVSAGIDMSLYLISLLEGVEMAKRVQQLMEYFPKPPVFDEVTA